MPGFRQTDNGVRLFLDAQEADILRGLAEEMRSLLGERRPRRDPVLRRLFPDAYETPEDQKEYAGLVGDDLAQHKREAAETVAGELGEKGRPAEVLLSGDAIDWWLAFLTDLRLAIGTRLDVDEERMAAEVDPKDPEAGSLTLLHWLGWIQQEIIEHATAQDA